MKCTTKTLDEKQNYYNQHRPRVTDHVIIYSTADIVHINYQRAINAMWYLKVIRLTQIKRLVLQTTHFPMTDGRIPKAINQLAKQNSSVNGKILIALICFEQSVKVLLSYNK